MTRMTTTPENYNNIRAGIVELLKSARSAAARNVRSRRSRQDQKGTAGLLQSGHAGFGKANREALNRIDKKVDGSKMEVNG
jgi:hypothetical protein